EGVLRRRKGRAPPGEGRAPGGGGAGRGRDAGGPWRTGAGAPGACRAVPILAAVPVVVAPLPGGRSDRDEALAVQGRSDAAASPLGLRLLGPRPTSRRRRRSGAPCR